MEAIVSRLLRSEEPSIRYRALTRVAGQPPDSREARAARKAIPACPRVVSLLSERDRHGRIPAHPYKKWFGAHWMLAALADLGYPPGGRSLRPLREQVCEWLFSTLHEGSTRAIQGRVRRCASQEGNALYAMLALGIADERADELSRRLIAWQWSDGGWNCDKRPDARRSSFMETLIPLRALALHGALAGRAESGDAAARAAEVFLSRSLFLGRRSGKVIRPDFVALHYPCYWHYDVLFGLKVMAEAGFIEDPRCGRALDLLESKRLPDGGFPAEKRYYRVTERAGTGRSVVPWGITGRTRSNEFVTVDALAVLRAAGRLPPRTARLRDFA